MSKHSFITILFSLVAIAGFGQEIKMNEPSFDDYIPVLNVKGYRAYRFDFHDFDGYWAKPVIKEYIDGKESDMPTLNPKFGVSLNDKLVIGFFPSENDSTVAFVYHSFSGQWNDRLPLRPIFYADKPKEPFYLYSSCPFELKPPFAKGQFIPLVFYASYWYDADWDEYIFRPSTLSYFLKYCPHFYIFGIEIQ